MKNAVGVFRRAADENGSVDDDLFEVFKNATDNFDSFILMVGIIQETFKFGYSYDITVSNLKNSNTLGAHELSFTLFMPCRSRSKSFNTISCPQF